MVMKTQLATATITLAILCSMQARGQEKPVAAAAPVEQSRTGETAATAARLLNSEQLQQLVAPIALYPDPLLAEVMMASTYPLEVVEAERWAKANKSLKGEQLKTALSKQRWDDSVKSLAATPTVLDMMSSKLDWTQKLGDAVLAQQSDVMDAVQGLRARAQKQNTLTTTKEQKVSVKTEQNKEVIVIEPTQPDRIYVPYYEPATVYGAWPYPAYPPYYWPRPYGYVAGAALAFGTAWAVGAAWGGGFGWGGNDININREVNIDRDRNTWKHNADHRQGVRYNNVDVAKKFDKGGDRRASADQRKDFRGHTSDGQPGRDGARADRDGARNTDRAQNPQRGDRNKPATNKGAGQTRDAAKSSGQKRDAANRSSGQRTAATGGGNRPQPSAQPRRNDNAFSGIQHGGGARAQADRGRSSMAVAHRGGGRSFSGGGGFRGGGGGRGGGRRR
jgi:hypothetical protein